MVNSNSDFYKYVDNFEQYSSVKSLLIYGEKAILNKVTVTIAIPTYNRVKLLKETIDSALNQCGFEDYCIIVVDNNPCRGCDTEKMILNYNTEKILYYKNQENIGMFGNQNRCFELPKSEWVVLLHDDDLLLPSYLMECMNVLTLRKNIDALQPPKKIWNDQYELRVTTDSCNKKKVKFHKLYDISNYLRFQSGAQTGGIFRRDAFVKIGGYNSQYYPTSDFVFAIQFSNCYNLYMLSKELVIYRISENESLRSETLNLFLRNDFYLKSAIMRRYHIPDVIVNLLSSKALEKQSLYLQKTFNKDFVPDFDDMHYFINSSKLRYFISRILVGAYVKLLTSVILPIKR
jgi:glycosyltransferase involved in cell wall biosynthesis